MKKKFTETAKMISMTILAILVYLTLIFITNSACAVFFCQPKEPSSLLNYKLKGDEYYNESSK